MNPRREFYALFALLILPLITLSCGDTRKANNLVDEGNAAVKEAQKFADDASARMNEINGKLGEFPQNRDELKPLAQAAIDNMDKGITKLREAQSKYEEGSKLNLDASLKEYLSLKSQEYGKHVEHLLAWKELANLIIDPSVEDADALKAKGTPILDRMEKLKQEWTDLAAKSDKIRQENKDKFKS